MLFPKGRAPAIRTGWFYTGYWFGNGMWARQNNVQQGCRSPGEYHLRVFFEGGRQGAQNYDLRVFEDAAGMRAASFPIYAVILI